MSFFKTVVISLGGSLIVPEEIDVNFLKNFKALVLGLVKHKQRVILVTGGGRVCRKYIQSAKVLNSKVTAKELDWMGIKATKVNAELVRIMFNSQAYFKVLDRPEEKLTKQKSRPIIVAGGWRPGASSDNMAVNLAKAFKAKVVVNLTNIDYVYDCDPNKFKTAKPIKQINWRNFRKLVGSKWDPGLNAPFDPIASQLAEKLNLTVAILNGQKLNNVKNYLLDKKFVGTLIKN